MALRVRGIRLGLLLGLALLVAIDRAGAQNPDALDRLRDLLPADSALAFGDRTDQADGLVLREVVIDLSWRSSRIRADRLALISAPNADDIAIELDGVFLRNAGGTLSADHMSLDGNAAAVLRIWGEVEAPNEDLEDETSEPAPQGAVDIRPGVLAAENVTIHAASQQPSQGWFIGDLAVSGLMPESVERLELGNLVVYAMGRVQASRLVLQGLDTAWMAGMSGSQDIIGGLLPPGGLALAIDDLAVLDQLGQPFVVVERISASLDGQPAPIVEGAPEEGEEREQAEEGEEVEGEDAAPPVGRLEIDLAADGFSLPIATLQPLPIAEQWASVLPETLSGTLRFAGTIDGPAQELTIASGLIDLADVVYLDAALSLADVSFAPDAPRMPLALVQLPGSIPMFSIAGGYLELEDRGLIAGLGEKGVPLPSETIDNLSTRLSNRLPMLAGRLDGILEWLREFESDGRATVRLEPATPAPAVELLSLMLINPDGVADRLGLSE